MEYSANINGVELNFFCDTEDIISKLNYSKTCFSKEKFQLPFTFGQGFGYLTKKEYNDNIKKVLSEMNKMTTLSYMEKAVIDAVKKSDGSYNKLKVYERVGCKNSTLNTTKGRFEWNYTELIIKPINDSTLLLDFKPAKSTCLQRY